MFELLVFDITPENTIRASMTLPRVEWFCGTNRIFDVFNYMMLDGYPIGVDHKKDGVTLVISWIMPLSLAKFLVDKFEMDSRCIVCHLKMWLIMQERPVIILQGELKP